MISEGETYLILAAFAAVGISLFVGIVIWRKMKESNDLLRSELNAKLRPIIVLGTPLASKVKLEDSIITWNEFNERREKQGYFEPQNIIFEIKAENIGLMPTKKLVVSDFFSQKKFGKNDLDTFSKKEEQNLTLQSSQSEIFSYVIPYKIWEKSDKYPWYLAWKFTYYLDKDLTKKEELVKIFEMTKGEITTLESF